MLKQRVLLGILSLLILVSVSGFAQQQSSSANQTDKLFVQTVYVERIYTHRLGYRVIYDKSGIDVGEVYIPARWFTQAAGKAEMIKTRSTSAPYMEVYYQNGEFAYLRLYAPMNPGDITWARLEPTQDVSGKFDKDTLDIAY